MSRGSLIFPFLVEIAQLDTVATEADPDGPGELTSGYDPIFNEVVKLRSPDLGGRSARLEKTIITLPCQWEVQNFEQQRQLPSGNAADTVTRIVLHFEDLEDGGLLAPDGSSLININDRIVRLLRCPFGELVRQGSGRPEPPLFPHQA